MGNHLLDKMNLSIVRITVLAEPEAWRKEKTVKLTITFPDQALEAKLASCRNIARESGMGTASAPAHLRRSSLLNTRGLKRTMNQPQSPETGSSPQKTGVIKISVWESVSGRTSLYSRLPCWGSGGHWSRPTLRHRDLRVSEFSAELCWR